MNSVIHKHEKAHDDGIWCSSWGKNERTDVEYIMSGSLDNGLKIWRWSENHLHYQSLCEGHRLGVISVDINATGTMAVSSGLDNQVLFWDLETGNLLKTYDGNPGETWTVVFSPDSRFVATGSHTGSINMLNVESGRKESAIQLLGDKFVYSLAYSPDGTRLAAGSVNGLVNICDLETGNVRPLDGHALPVRSLAFSPDGRLLASSSDDKQIRVYDVYDGRTVISSLNGHKGWVVSVDFSPDMRHLATASTDRTVRLWDLGTKLEQHTFSEHEDQIWCTRYSPCGSKLMSVGDDRSIIVYGCTS